MPRIEVNSDKLNARPASYDNIKFSNFKILIITSSNRGSLTISLGVKL